MVKRVVWEGFFSRKGSYLALFGCTIGNLTKHEIYRYKDVEGNKFVNWVDVSTTWESRKMTKSHKKTEALLRVVKLTQPDGRQMSLLIDDERILCYQSRPDVTWHPIEPEYLGLALAINRW